MDGDVRNFDFSSSMAFKGISTNNVTKATSSHVVCHILSVHCKFGC